MIGENVPVTLGVPLINPPADRFTPEGKDPPIKDQTKDPVPPDACNCWEYATFWVAVWSGLEVVIDKGMQEIVVEKFPDAELAALSVTLIVAVNVPAAAGVPVIDPPDEIDIPVGKAPDVMLQV
jgi:hypothetical protein